MVAGCGDVCTICVQTAQNTGDGAVDFVRRLCATRLWLWRLWIRIPLSAHAHRTAFAQFVRRLDIQLLPNVGNLLAHNVVELNSLFDFFDRVNSSGVVFAAELAGNFRKTQV